MRKKDAVTEKKIGLNEVFSTYNILTPDNDVKSVDSFMRERRVMINKLLAEEIIRKR